MKFSGLLFLAGGLLLASCDNNKSSSTTTTTDSNKAIVVDNGSGMNANNNNDNKSKDQDFVSDVIAANMAEIDAHTAAQTHATSKEVKMHAEHMLADHKKLGEEMKAYAQKKNYTIPTAPPEDKKKDLDDMNADKKGADWDKAYLDMQEKDHEKTIKKFEDAQDDVADTELKNMITKTLPTLRAHLDMVKQAKDKMK